MADWQPTASPEVLRHRAGMLHQVRQFFAARNVLEVETPVLTRCGVTDPNIKSLAVKPLQTGHTLFLHTSPEFAMKRMLAAGLPDIYQVCKVFRDGEQGAQHQPEFTMIEWYRRDWSMLEMLDETCSLICELIDLPEIPIQKISYRELFQQSCEFDPCKERTESISDWAKNHIKTIDAPLAKQLGNDRTAWLDLIISHAITPSLAPDTLHAVHHFPAEQCSLARINPDDPSTAERFEIIYQGMELANGFQELTNAKEQRQRFEDDNRTRLKRAEAAMPIDEQFLAALDAGLPDCSGVAVGFDRLVMLACGLGHIDQAVSFALTAGNHS